MSEIDHNEGLSELVSIALIIHLGQKETFDHSFNNSLSKYFMSQGVSYVTGRHQWT